MPLNVTTDHLHALQQDTIDALRREAICKVHIQGLQDISVLLSALPGAWAHGLYMTDMMWCGTSPYID